MNILLRAAIVEKHIILNVMRVNLVIIIIFIKAKTGLEFQTIQQSMGIILGRWVINLLLVIKHIRLIQILDF